MLPSDSPSAQPAVVGRTSSAKKIQANRENAQGSTGPRTKEGKKRSSRNAEKHGGLSTVVEPIRKGPFAEDPEFFRLEVARLVKSLRPEGTAQKAIATRIAGVLIKLGRIDRWVAAVIEECSTPDQLTSALGFGRELPPQLVAHRSLSGPMDLDLKYQQRAVKDLLSLLGSLRDLKAQYSPPGGVD